MYARPFETKAQWTFGTGIVVFSLMYFIVAASVKSTNGSLLTILFGDMRLQMPCLRYKRADVRRANLVNKRRRGVSLIEAEADDKALMSAIFP